MTRNGIDLYHLAALIFHIFSDTRTKEDSADECAHAADRMNGGRACKIMEAARDKPTLRIPHPAGFDRIDDSRNNGRIDAVCAEFGTFCHSARNDGSRRCAEHEVKYKTGSVGLDKRAEIGEYLHIRHADKTEQIVFRHHQRKADENKRNCADAEVHKVLHNDVAGVFGSGKASFYHGKACLHEENKCGSDQIPDTESIAFYERYD